MGILSPLPQQKDEQWRSQEGWGTRDWRHQNIYILRVATRLEEEMEHDLWSVVEVSVFGFTETNPYPARKFSENTGVKGARQQPRRH